MLHSARSVEARIDTLQDFGGGERRYHVVGIRLIAPGAVHATSSGDVTGKPCRQLQLDAEIEETHCEIRGGRDEGLLVEGESNADDGSVSGSPQGRVASRDGDCDRIGEPASSLAFHQQSESERIEPRVEGPDVLGEVPAECRDGLPE
jgi:hypothetical protein